MTAQTNLYIQPSTARSKQNARRRRELISVILDGLATMGIGVSFIACAILFLCII
ncbi:MAG: hypothetical protein IKP19_08130 [Oscillospiraceae bacterium]|nr:hypothetical protein [Oscillospiraceae bacterium]